MKFGQVRKQEKISIRRLEAGSVTDVHIGGYRARACGSIHDYAVTESRLAYP
jgi:hypothetical protein